MAAVHHLGFVLRTFGPPTKNKKYLVVFIAVHNLVGIGIVVLKICEFQYYASLA